MEEPDGVRILRRLLDEGFAHGRTEIVDELTTDDLVEHQFGLAGTGTEARDRLRRAMREVHEMSADLTYVIEDWATNGDRVWVRATGTGTFTGPLFGPPSGQPFEVAVIDVVRIEDGRVAEHWGVPDRFALLAQNGVLERLKPSQPA